MTRVRDHIGTFHERPSAALLPDGHRLHLQHGPIDLIVGADGDRNEVGQAYRQAARYFETVLDTLAGELDLLRQPCSQSMVPADGAIARQMQARASEFAGNAFVTPMAAVAGAVADHVLQALLHKRQLDRAYVNNGGDIALWLGPDAYFDIGVCTNAETGRLGSKVRITADDMIGGIATSGWRGRSHSLGIADAVTVLAGNAAAADVAATLIANAVDIPGSPAIRRRPARELAPDSDLGDRLVTVAVGELGNRDVDAALERGSYTARKMIDEGRIVAAFIALAGRATVCWTSGRAVHCQPEAVAPTLTFA